MLIEKMVESSVIPTGPRSVANNKPIIDLNGLNNNNNNNNNNESDNEKPEPHEMNGHVIKTFDSLEDEDEEDEDFATASSSEEDDETPETGVLRVPLRKCLISFLRCCMKSIQFHNDFDNLLTRKKGNCLLLPDLFDVMNSS